MTLCGSAGRTVAHRADAPGESTACLIDIARFFESPGPGPRYFHRAVLGDHVGFWFGNKIGPPIFNRPNSRFFRRQNLLKAKEFYDRRGAVNVTAARFMPFIRTFAPIVAGEVDLRYRTFFPFSRLGCALAHWGDGSWLSSWPLSST